MRTHSTSRPPAYCREHNGLRGHVKQHLSAAALLLVSSLCKREGRKERRRTRRGCYWCFTRTEPKPPQCCTVAPVFVFFFCFFADLTPADRSFHFRIGGRLFRITPPPHPGHLCTARVKVRGCVSYQQAGLSCFVDFSVICKVNYGRKSIFLPRTDA